MSSKTATGVRGLDEITDGGIPAGRLTVVTGDAGSGKTILSLQFLTSGATQFGEPGIFVAFEETRADVARTAASFGWVVEEFRPGSDTPRQGGVLVLEANPTADMVQAGDFDFTGLLAMLGDVAGRTGAKRIVLDAVDVLLDFSTVPRPDGGRSSGSGTGRSQAVSRRT